MPSYRVLSQSKYLLLDGRIIDRVRGAKLTVGKPKKHPRNPLFGEDRSWEVRFDNMYPNAVFDERDRCFKLWYTLFVVDPATTRTPRKKRLEIPGLYGKTDHVYREKGRPREMGLCFAKSKDGLAWEKPELGNVAFGGSKKNNLIGRGLHGMGVFLDSRDPDPKRRFKMFGKLKEGKGPEDLGVIFSGDGVRWGKPVPCPEIHGPGDTHNNAFWAPTLGKYVGITRLTYRTDKWPFAVRQVGRTESRDFVRWTKARLVLEGPDPLHQTYSMPVCFYAGIYLGFPAFFEISRKHEGRTRTELAWSPDTRTWHRIDPGSPLIPTAGKKGSYDWGTAYGSAPVFFEDHIRLYYGGCNRGHGDWRDGFLCLATLRPDRFAGYTPKSRDTTATVTTKEIRCVGSDLRVTADIRRGGSVRVGIVGERRLGLANSVPITRTVTNGSVRWKNEEGLSGLVRGKVRLNFELKKAKLFAFGFKA